MKITQNERQFLIVWVLLNALILTTDVLHFRGLIKTTKDGYDYVNFNFNVGGNLDKFWPLVSFTEDSHSAPKATPRYDGMAQVGQNISYDYYKQFNGIFAFYDLSEFVVYVVLGLCIVFIPKIWKHEA